MTTQTAPDARSAAGRAVAGAQPMRPVVTSAKAADHHPTRVGKSGGGLASWYGARFQGRPTANGERFDMGGFTAAHRSFPLPSYVRVTNVSNGRSIVVRVNDRGPFHGGRVIDVSHRAADVLGFRGHGVGTVKLDLIGPAPEDGSDDRKLLASYQEFGRPAAPPGTQLAMAPVSDSQLAGETMGYGERAIAVANAAVTRSADFVKSSAVTVASGAKSAIGKVIPAAPENPTSTVPAEPVVAYAAEERRPTPKPRVVAPSEPVLASAAPASSAAEDASGERPSLDVSSRIAAGFDSFGSFDDAASQLRSGALR